MATGSAADVVAVTAAQVHTFDMAAPRNSALIAGAFVF